MNRNNPLGGILRNFLKTYKSLEIEKLDEMTSKTTFEENHKAKELKWNKVSVIVNIFLAFISLGVLYLTVVQTKTSSDAVTVAVDALNHQIKKDSVDSISSEKATLLQQQSVTAQIEALHAARDQFNREHENFLEITDLKIDFTNTAKNPLIKFSLANYGSIVFVRSSKFAMSIGTPNDSVSIKKNALNALYRGVSAGNPTYISQQTPRSMSMEWSGGSLQGFKKITNDPFIIFVCGEVHYVSLIRKQHMVLTFIAATQKINEVEYKILSIKNEEFNR